MIMGDQVKVCSLNCQGLGDHDKRRDVFKYLKKLKYSIVCLQDTHFSKKSERLIESEWGFKTFFNSLDSRSRGVAILFNNNFELKVHSSFSDNSGNVLFVSAEINDKLVLLVNIYGPNKDNPEFYTLLNQRIHKYEINNILIVGDWNLLLNPEIDCFNYKHINNPRARQEVLHIKNNLMLFDVWREENMEEKKFTWKRKLQGGELQMGRLDFFLLSESLTHLSCKEKILPGYRTDHSIIEITLNFSKDVFKSRTFWKFNNSLLFNTDFITEAKENIFETKKQYGALCYNRENIKDIDNEFFQTYINPQLFLEMILLNVRSLSISFSSALRKCDNEKEKNLERKILTLENDPVNNFEEIHILNTELKELREKKLKGSFIRSRAKWIDEGEKPTRYFCNLENRNFVSKRMTSLVNDQGIELTTPCGIKSEVNSFYQNLYKSREHLIQNVDLHERLNDTTPTLSDEQAYSLEGPISFEEASNTLKKMQNGKSPGSTGFTTEFFKIFWKDIGYFVVNSLNFGFLNGEFSTTQKEGVITCIPKPNKSKKYIKNWRPISLLNITYKIATGCIANRLKKILPNIIDLDQSGFISGRFTGDNIRLIYDLLFYGKQQQKKGLMLLIDFEKAFDTVAWSFIQKCFKFYNFKEDIINWIKAFYKNIKSTVIVNNEPTEWFPVERGCRQGDPISPYIFLLCGEILAHMIRQSDDIKGYNLLDKEIKISQYADDTSLFLDGTPESFEYCVHSVLEYAKYSGLAMNFDKTKVVWFGCKDEQNVFLPEMKFEWNPKKFSILGIEFTSDLEEITNKNIENKLIDMQREINNWSRRNLTPFGKVTVIKSIILSKIVHILIALPTPSQNMLKKINNMLFNFLWDGKPDKIKRKTARNKIEKGGIGMIDVESFNKALKLTWIRRLLKGETKWKSVTISLYPKIENIMKYGNDYIHQLHKSIENPFWSDVMLYLFHFYDKFCPSCLEDLYETSFLYNNKIKIDKFIISNRFLENNNIHLIKHLIENDEFLSYNAFSIKYNIQINQLTFMSIIRAIKKSTNINDLEREGKRINQQPPYHHILKDKKGASNIYNIFIEEKIESKGYKRWEEKLGLSEEEWTSGFTLLKFTTRDTRLRWLQLRILHNILTTNRIVSKFTFNQSDLCTFCHNHSETIQHLFWGCDTVQEFWESLTRLINRRCKHSHDFRVDEKLVLFGQSEYLYTDEVCNLIILLSKMYIYKSKVKGSPLSINCFVKELFSRYNTEKIVYKGSQDFLNKWSPYLDLFRSLG